MSIDQKPTFKDFLPLIVDLDGYEKAKKDAATMTKGEMALEFAKMADRGITRLGEHLVEEEVGPPPEKFMAEEAKQWKNIGSLITGDVLKQSPKQWVNEIVEERRAEANRPGMIESAIADIRDGWRGLVRALKGGHEKSR